ncbi:MAG: NAD(P)-binding domain-containing protein, partial [Woeseiaceae bacterium]
MQLGIIGLGKMGANMARRLRRAEIDVVGFNRDNSTTEKLAKESGLLAAESIEAMLDALETPRVVWLMLPAGEVTESHIESLRKQLQPGDILVDGANSWYKDSMRRGELLAQSAIHFVDAGVSGGVWGLENGYALMVGGAEEAFSRLRPAIEALAPAKDRGWV